MQFLLFDKDEKYIATLKDVLDAEHTEELNGENVLELTTLDVVEKGQRVLYKDIYGHWQEFIIKGVEEHRGHEGLERTAFAEHSIYETLGDYIEDKRPQNVSASGAMQVALGPTRWQVGIVEDLGINSTNFYHISAKEAIQKVAEIWQGDLRYRVIVSGTKITARYVDLLDPRGRDLGKRFTYTKDLEEITKKTHRDDVITALYGYGKGQEIVDEEGQPTGGYGRRIDFADINNGKAYVENLEAKEIWGRLNPDGTKSHVFGKVEFDDCEDKYELLQLTKDKLAELSKPLTTYEAKVIDLKAFGFEHEGVELGDTVAVIDREFNPELRLKARVIKIVKDLLEPENNDITLGNFIPSIVDSWNEQEKYINNFRGKQGVWDRSQIINQDGTINAQYLNNIVEELNANINASGGYVYVSEDGDGLITYDRPIDQNPTKAIQLKGGSFRIANSKLPNGEWNWRSFGTGDGFVADMIIAGVLSGGKVKFDLTNGTLLIGNSVEDYRLLWDGSTLKIKGDIEVEALSDISSDIGSVTQGIITGAIVRTNSGADRLEMSDDSFKAFLDEKKRVEYTNDRINFYGPTGGYSGNIIAVPEESLGILALSMLANGIAVVKAYDTNGRGAHLNLNCPITRGSGNDVPSMSELTTRDGSGFCSITNFPGEINLLTSNRDTDGVLVQTPKMRVWADFAVVGSKNALHETTNYGSRLINAYETAEYYFGDVGSGKIGDDGLCYIDIDHIFGETINTKVQYHVFLQKRGKGDIWIKYRTENYFIVQGTPGISFSWEIKAKRLGYEYNRLEQVSSIKPPSIDVENINDITEDERTSECHDIHESELMFDLTSYLEG